MKRRKLLFGTFYSLAIMQFKATHTQAQPSAFGLDLYNTLVSANLIYTVWDNILKNSVVPLLKVLPWKNLNINKSFEADSLNIYVTNSHFGAMRSSPPGRFREIILASRDNFLALPANIILVDKTVMAKVLQAAVEYGTAAFEVTEMSLLAGGSLSSVLENSTPTPANADQSAEFALAVAALVERRLMKIYSQLLSDEGACDHLANKLATDFEIQKNAPASTKMFEKRLETYTAVLAPIIFHEAAHLLNRDLGTFLDYLSRLQKEIFGPSLREREDAADKYSTQLLGKFIDQNGFVNNPAALLGLRAFMGYLTARIWPFVFDGFRGMDAQQFFWQFEYVSCDQWDTWFRQLRSRWDAVASKVGANPNEIPTIETLKKNSNGQANLENWMLLRRGSMTGFPLLTKSEFAAIVSKTRGSLGDGSHAPHFIRAFRFSSPFVTLLRRTFGAEFEQTFGSLIDPYVMSGRMLGRELLLIDAVMEANPKLIEPLKPQFEGAYLEASITQIRTAFEDIFTFEPAVNCRSSHCFVGTLKSGRLGYIELIGDKKGLSRVRVASKWGQDGDDKYFGNGGLKDEKKYKEAFAVLVLLAELAGAAIDIDPRNTENIVRLLTDITTSIRNQFVSCQFASYSGRIERAAIDIESKESGWMVLTANAVR